MQSFDHRFGAAITIVLPPPTAYLQLP